MSYVLCPVSCVLCPMRPVTRLMHRGVHPNLHLHSPGTLCAMGGELCVSATQCFPKRLRPCTKLHCMLARLPKPCQCRAWGVECQGVITCCIAFWLGYSRACQRRAWGEVEEPLPCGGVCILLPTLLPFFVFTCWVFQQPCVEPGWVLVCAPSSARHSHP